MREGTFSSRWVPTLGTNLAGRFVTFPFVCPKKEQIIPLERICCDLPGGEIFLGHVPGFEVFITFRVVDKEDVAL